MRKEYTTVKIPTELAKRLDSVSKDLGYRSRAEIVNDAIRRYIDSRTKEIEHLDRLPLIQPR
jgi:metal-responsive CopG/Arc/MetJ family transcriptional regulator